MKVVRWLGAFGRAPSVDDMIAFEAAPARNVSVAASFDGAPIGGARVGLVVDTRQTKLVAGYAGDAWTSDSKKAGGVVNDARDIRVHRWTDVPACVRVAKERGERYAECVVAHPRYSAVVYGKAAGERTKAIARKVARAMGLPLRAI